MKNWKIMLCSGLVLCPLLLPAQEKTTSSGRIGFEFGSNAFFGETIVPERIRASKSVHYDDFCFSSPNPNQVLENHYGGIKYESFFNNNHLGLTVGLRFSQFSSKINTDWNHYYFVWLFRQDETATDYLTIQNIKQKNNYLGVPLELRYLLRRWDSFFNPYFKFGAAVNYCLSTTNSIAFFDPEMSRYSGAVSEEIEKPNLVNAWVYPAFGFKFGRMNKVWFNMEVHFPGFLIGEKAHPFIRPDVGMGIQLSMQIPLNK